MTPLEGRYRRWMVTYPTEYRQQHQSEILGTLLEAAGPAQTWPSLREVVALLIGGLRTRAWLAGKEPGRLWADGLRIGAIVFLIQTCSFAISVSLVSTVVVDSISQLAVMAQYPVVLALAAGGLVALARAHVIASLGTVVVMVPVQLAARTAGQYVPPLTWLDMLPVGWPLAAGILAILAASPSLRSVRHAWTWRATSLAVAAIPLQTLCFIALDRDFRLVPPLLVPLLLGAVEVIAPAAILLVWAVVTGDPRPSLAATICLAIGVAGQAQTLVAASHYLNFQWSEYELKLLVTVMMAAGALLVTTVRSQRLSGIGRT